MCIKGHTIGPILIHDGFLIYKDRLYIPHGFVREALILELHCGGHFGRDKMIGMIEIKAVLFATIKE